MDQLRAIPRATTFRLLRRWNVLRKQKGLPFGSPAKTLSKRLFKSIHSVHAAHSAAALGHCGWVLFFDVGDGAFGGEEKACD